MNQEQIPLFFEDIYDALRYVVQAAGGAKVVGSQLFSSKDPEPAARALMDCLNSNRAEKLDPEQLVTLLRLAHERGCHEAINYICSRTGYSRPEPIAARDENAELQRQFIKAVTELRQLSSRINGSTA